MAFDGAKVVMIPVVLSSSFVIGWLSSTISEIFLLSFERDTRATRFIFCAASQTRGGKERILAMRNFKVGSRVTSIDMIDRIVVIYKKLQDPFVQKSVPESCISVFERNFDNLTIFFDDKDTGIDVFRLEGEGVLGIAVEGLTHLRIVDFYFMSFFIFKF